MEHHLLLYMEISNSMHFNPHQNDQFVINMILCSANILLNKSLQAKIGDFGFSRKLPQTPQGYTLVTAAMTVKSLGYSAPELDGRKQFPKSDVYSYGVVSLIAYHNRIIVNHCCY